MGHDATIYSTSYFLNIVLHFLNCFRVIPKVDCKDLNLIYRPFVTYARFTHALTTINTSTIGHVTSDIKLSHFSYAMLKTIRMKALKLTRPVQHTNPWKGTDDQRCGYRCGMKPRTLISANLAAMGNF